MILSSFKYIRDKGKDSQWTLAGRDFNSVYFENTNLIVGKNATGKSRSLTIFGDLAEILSLKLSISVFKSSNWEYEVTFKDGDDIYNYMIFVEKGSIINEIISINQVEKYNRTHNQIYSETLQTLIKVNVSEKEVITTLYANEQEYPYLTKLHEWGKSLRKVAFTNQFDKNYLLKKEELDTLEQVQPENTIHIFNDGKKKFESEFIDAIKNDLQHLGYLANDVLLQEFDNGIGISVYEDELSVPTSQTDMSQGMFRALAFIINLNYFLLSKLPVCMLIDDLGEGLDYTRSRSLIDLLIRKINDSNIQIFITSNDRYVMNAIPIKYWSILERVAKASIFYNYYNSREIFEDFKYTGLNNFDLLATDFYHHGFENEI